MFLLRLIQGLRPRPWCHRGRWLKKLAREFEGYTPSPTARRLRRLQARRHHGQKCYRLTLYEIEVEQLLQAAGTLAPGDPDHAAVERALERFISLCILDHRNAFQPDREIYDTVRVKLCLSALRGKVSGGPPKRRR